MNTLNIGINHKFLAHNREVRNLICNNVNEYFLWDINKSQLMQIHFALNNTSISKKY